MPVTKCGITTQKNGINCVQTNHFTVFFNYAKKVGEFMKVKGCLLFGDLFTLLCPIS